MLDLMNRLKYNMMNEDNKNNKGPVIISKSIDLVEIVDEEIDLQVIAHPHLITLTKIGDHHYQGGPDPVDIGTQGVINQGLVGVQDQQGVEETHQKRRGDHDQRKERTNIGTQRIEEGEIPLLHQGNKKLSNKRKQAISLRLPSQLNQRQWNLNR